MTESNRRVLIVDDNRAIHDDFRKILTRRAASELGDLEAELFGAERASPIGFELTSAYQGAEGAALVRAARAADQPFALAVVDMRMPHTLGHSRAVAALADAAGKRMGLPAQDIRELRWAAYTHDIGELAVPVSTWMRAGALTIRESDAAQLHPYHGERALASLGGEGKPVAALVLQMPPQWTDGGKTTSWRPWLPFSSKPSTSQYRAGGLLRSLRSPCRSSTTACSYPWSRILGWALHRRHRTSPGHQPA